MVRTIHTLLVLVTFCFASALWSRSAAGQEFRVYTRVAQAAPGDKAVDARMPLARSTTLFHAGKAYDYLDSSGEITVFEPTHDKFWLVSPARKERTTVSFSEIETRLHQASKRAERFLLEERTRGTSDSAALVALVETQLRPNLRESLSADGKTLKLESPVMTYQATLSKSPDTAMVGAYARYVDWTARLNFVLYPKSTPPAPRLMLNAALVRHSSFPMTVRLEIHQQAPLILEATHQFEWKLSSTDRRQVQQWEQALVDPSYKAVSFDAFRRAK